MDKDIPFTISSNLRYNLYQVLIEVELCNVNLISSASINLDVSKCIAPNLILNEIRGYLKHINSSAEHNCSARDQEIHERKYA